MGVLPPHKVCLGARLRGGVYVLTAYRQIPLLQGVGGDLRPLHCLVPFLHTSASMNRVESGLTRVSFSSPSCLVILRSEPGPESVEQGARDSNYPELGPALHPQSDRRQRLGVRILPPVP